MLKCSEIRRAFFEASWNTYSESIDIKRCPAGDPAFGLYGLCGSVTDYAFNDEVYQNQLKKLVLI